MAEHLTDEEIAALREEAVLQHANAETWYQRAVALEAENATLKAALRGYRNSTRSHVMCIANCELVEGERGPDLRCPGCRHVDALLAEPADG